MSRLLSAFQSNSICCIGNHFGKIRKRNFESKFVESGIIFFSVGPAGAMVARQTSIESCSLKSGGCGFES